jgi:DNA repair protein
MFVVSFTYFNLICLNHYKIYIGCRDYKGVHKLIARTEAKETYLLKDADLDLREPPLRYVERRNPHRPGGTMMRLYLEMQVKKNINIEIMSIVV